ncbi:hypothetical protein, partial [Streptomyces sp. NPDC127574]|uniref:hypothetical protein n=1 Tax=Streptomyces sp. NPDC127574 TaxID=3345401 RepID=UPI0036335F27
MHHRLPAAAVAAGDRALDPQAAELARAGPRGGEDRRPPVAACAGGIRAQRRLAVADQAQRCGLREVRWPGPLQAALH